MLCPPLPFFPQMHLHKFNPITCLNSMQKPQWPHCLSGTAAHFIGQYWGFHFKTAWSAERIPNLRSIWQPDGFHLIPTDFTKTPTCHDSDPTTVAEIVWLAAKAFLEQNCTTLAAHSHISDCHVFIRCNPAEPFIVNCSQRLALSTERQSGWNRMHLVKRSSSRQLRAELQLQIHLERNWSLLQSVAIFLF